MRVFTCCREGKLKRIKAHLEGFDTELIKEKLGLRLGHFGTNSIHEAANNGRHQVLKYLLELVGGDIDLNSHTGSGYTPLHLAASSGHRECVQILLDYGADISSRDGYGKTAKQVAELGNKKSIRILLHSEGEMNKNYNYVR